MPTTGGQTSKSCRAAHPQLASERHPQIVMACPVSPWVPAAYELLRHALGVWAREGGEASKHASVTGDQVPHERTPHSTWQDARARPRQRILYQLDCELGAAYTTALRAAPTPACNKEACNLAQHGHNSASAGSGASRRASQETPIGRFACPCISTIGQLRRPQLTGDLAPIVPRVEPPRQVCARRHLVNE